MQDNQGVHATDKPEAEPDSESDVPATPDPSEPAKSARPYSYGSRDVQPGYESQGPAKRGGTDHTRSTRYDSPPPDPRESYSDDASR